MDHLKDGLYFHVSYEWESDLNSMCPSIVAVKQTEAELTAAHEASLRKVFVRL